MARRRIEESLECDIDLDDMLDDDFGELPVNRPRRRKYKEPESWTIIQALDRVLTLARGSELSDEFWKKCKKPLDFLKKELGLTDVQIVVIALLVESGEPLSWKSLGNYLHCSRLTMMTYTEEIENLIEKRWIFRRGTREMGRMWEGFNLAYGVVSALRHNKPFVPEKIDGLTIQEFVDRLESHISRDLRDNSMSFSDDELWMRTLCKANEHLPLCRTVLGISDDIHVQSLLLMTVFDYALWADTDDEGVEFQSIDRTYPDEYEADDIRKKLQNGTHPLIEAGLIEHKCEDGIANTSKYMLTRNCKEELLAGFVPSKSKSAASNADTQNLKSFTTIKQKDMFYNTSDEEQIERLTSLLNQDNLPAIQKRLEEQGMRKGFACLFYGAPGTGKTETVLQIARQTGRDIMQVDIASMKDKYVGESEKNIKAVFTNYKKLCKSRDVMPILFFNEADALINKRTENLQQASDKMNNAMQNILLQEIEDLDGILIATTNLTGNLDNAFERRFLFKVEFHKPDNEIKAKLWSSMLKGDISEEDASRLAEKYDFSGGQIENIARKRTIEYILSGKKASFEEINSYCQHELLDKKNERKQIIGFRC